MNRLGVLKPVWDFLTSEKVQNLSVALAVLIGGAWSLYTYRVSEERSADARKPVVKAAFMASSQMLTATGWPLTSSWRMRVVARSSCSLIKSQP